MKRRLLACFALLAGFVLAPSGPASAHSDDGVIEIVSIKTTGPLTVRVETRITFVGDGHGAPAATATVVADRAGAPSVGPMVLTVADAGSYGATLTLPMSGEWTFRVSSLSPTAVTERVEAIAAPPASTTTASPSTTAIPTSSVAPAPAATAVTSTTDDIPTPSSQSANPAGKNKVATTLAFAGIMLAIVVIAALAVRSSRTARRAQGRL